MDGSVDRAARVAAALDWTERMDPRDVIALWEEWMRGRHPLEWRLLRLRRRPRRGVDADDSAAGRSDEVEGLMLSFEARQVVMESAYPPPFRPFRR